MCVLFLLLLLLLLAVVHVLMLWTLFVITNSVFIAQNPQPTYNTQSPVAAPPTPPYKRSTHIQSKCVQLNVPLKKDWVKLSWTDWTKPSQAKPSRTMSSGFGCFVDFVGCVSSKQANWLGQKEQNIPPPPIRPLCELLATLIYRKTTMTTTTIYIPITPNQMRNQIEMNKKERIPHIDNSNSDSDTKKSMHIVQCTSNDKKKNTNESYIQDW